MTVTGLAKRWPTGEPTPRCHGCRATPFLARKEIKHITVLVLVRLSVKVPTSSAGVRVPQKVDASSQWRRIIYFDAKTL